MKMIKETTMKPKSALALLLYLMLCGLLVETGTWQDLLLLLGLLAMGMGSLFLAVCGERRARR